MVRLLVLLLPLIAQSTASAKAQKVFQTLSCAYEDTVLNHKFQIEADMIDSTTFIPDATYFGDDIYIYELTQKPVQQNEKHRFILDESDPDNAVLVKVYKDEKSEAILLGLPPPFNFVKSSCFYY